MMYRALPHLFTRKCIRGHRLAARHAVAGIMGTASALCTGLRVWNARRAASAALDVPAAPEPTALLQAE